MKMIENNADEARKNIFLSPTVGARNVPMNCGPLNLTNTLNWSLPMELS